MQRIQTLDGWRGVAILLVVVEHAAFHSAYRDRFWAAQGAFGVDIFFVLSGYIITTRLLAESDESGRFSLAEFYRRRAIRILPVTCAYLVCLAVLAWCVDMRDVKGSELLGSLFLFRNYQIAAHPGGIFTAHFWSLSIEEHFYLLWPAILYFAGRRRGLWVALSAAITCAIWRHHDYGGTWISKLLAGSDNSAYFHIIRTDTRLDGLLLGCVMAMLLRRPDVRGFVFRNFPKELPLLVCFPTFVLLQRGEGLPSLLSYALIVIAMTSTLIVEEGLAHKWLNHPALLWIGRISFSLYVWQELFLMHPDGFLPLGRLQMFPMNVIAAFATASLSYYLIERPLSRRRGAGWRGVERAVEGLESEAEPAIA